MKPPHPALARVLKVVCYSLPGLLGYWYGSHHPQAPTPGDLADLRPSPAVVLGQSRSELGDEDLTGALRPQAAGVPDRPPAPSAGRGSLRQRLWEASEGLEAMDSSQLLRRLREMAAQPASPETPLLQGLVTAELAERDPQMALSFAASLAAEQRPAAEQLALSVWMKHDPAAASAYFTEHLDDFGVLSAGQRAAAGSIAAQWAQSDPHAARRWAEELPEEVRVEALVPIMAELGRTHPEEVVEAINAAEPGYERSQLMAALVSERAGQVPQATAAWVLGIGDPSEQSEAASTLARTWAKSDLTSAAGWAAALSPGPARDAAINSLLEVPAFRQDPGIAEAWAASIEDRALREAALQRVASRWQILGPAGPPANETDPAR